MGARLKKSVYKKIVDEVRKDGFWLTCEIFRNPYHGNREIMYKVCCENFEESGLPGLTIEFSMKFPYFASTFSMSGRVFPDDPYLDKRQLWDGFEKVLPEIKKRLQAAPWGFKNKR